VKGEQKMKANSFVDKQTADENQFTVFPAIDLRAGKVVRLAQGDPDRQTIYGNDPLVWAERWKSEGADWLHVINLSSVFEEDSKANLEALKSILNIGLRVEYGGGLREPEHIRATLDLGVERLFLGTAAIQNPALVDWAIAQYGSGCIAGDIGARDGIVMIKGWQESTSLTALEVGRRFRDQGIQWCVLTDVNRDGVNRGVDVASAVRLQQEIGLSVIGSGGVSSREDVQRAREAKLSGVIIGRALYDGKVSLREVLNDNDC
jgi:phosphoribosylformimino-5-aminoimidazole carboxamide ribotide isomerase